MRAHINFVDRDYIYAEPLEVCVMLRVGRTTSGIWELYFTCLYIALDMCTQGLERRACPDTLCCVGITCDGLSQYTHETHPFMTSLRLVLPSLTFQTCYPEQAASEASLILCYASIVLPHPHTGRLATEDWLLRTGGDNCTTCSLFQESRLDIL